MDTATKFTNMINIFEFEKETAVQDISDAMKAYKGEMAFSKVTDEAMFLIFRDLSSVFMTHPALGASIITQVSEDVLDRYLMGTLKSKNPRDAWNKFTRLGRDYQETFINGIFSILLREAKKRISSQNSVQP